MMHSIMLELRIRLQASAPSAHASSKSLASTQATMQDDHDSLSHEQPSRDADIDSLLREVHNASCRVKARMIMTQAWMIVTGVMACDCTQSIWLNIVEAPISLRCLLRGLKWVVRDAVSLSLFVRIIWMLDVFVAR